MSIRAGTGNDGKTTINQPPTQWDRDIWAAGYD